MSGINNPPDFIFNEKTGELQRGGKLLALRRMHADIFGCLARAQGPIGISVLIAAIGMPRHSIADEIPSLARRLASVGIRICASRDGRWLEFGPMPKWQPVVPPPHLLPGERP